MELSCASKAYTWTGKAHAKSEYLLDSSIVKNIVKNDPKNILNDIPPELIDEWTYVPELWDLVRRKCDGQVAVA